MSRKYKHSLRYKAALFIVIITFIVSSASILAGAHIINNYITRRYKLKATELAATIAATIDGDTVMRLKDKIIEIYDKTEPKVSTEYWDSDDFNVYISRFSSIENDSDYLALLEYLRKVHNVNEIQCTYISWVDADTKSVLYLVDSAMEDQCPPGSFDPLFEINKNILTNPDAGFPAYMTDTELYGNLVTAGVPIYTSDEKIAGYSFVDISMKNIDQEQNRQVLWLFLMDGFISLIICFICIKYVHRTVTSPINNLRDAALSYSGTDRKNSLTSSRFLELDIHTGDEIEQLCESMKQMERDMNDNITSIISMTNELTEKKIEVSQISKMARTDSLTSVHNKLAYDEAVYNLTEEIKAGNTVFGLAVFDLNNLKAINDTYGHDRGNDYIIHNVRVVCEEFKYSPVFRIGGDEFVVVLKNADYENIDYHLAKIDELNSQSAMAFEINDWERTSIAFGYALYDSHQDNSVASVFHRADMAMYKKKKIMKGL